MLCLGAQHFSGSAVAQTSEERLGLQATPPAKAVVGQPASLVSVESLLKRATEAVRSLSYKGIFTYEYGSVLETLELVHAVTDGIEHERVLHLSGSKREFLRSGRTSECDSVAGVLLRGDALIAEGVPQRLSDHYTFLISGSRRIAGREVTLVRFQPKDNLRLLRVMGFDSDTGLPLLLVTSDGKSYLERFQFVELEHGEQVTVDDLKPESGPVVVLDAPTRCAQRQKQGSPARWVGAGLLSVPGAAPSWKVRWVPKGFVISQSSPEPGYTEVMTYSDGLSTFTLFVVDLSEADMPFKNGVARMGATLALTQAVEWHGRPFGLAVVGEIPPVTAKKVLSSMVPVR